MKRMCKKNHPHSTEIKNPNHVTKINIGNTSIIHAYADAYIETYNTQTHWHTHDTHRCQFD
jgi:hypothetical protein